MCFIFLPIVTSTVVSNPAFGEETEKGQSCDPDPDIHVYSLIEDDREYVNTRGIPVGSLLSVLRAKGEDDYTSEFKVRAPPASTSSAVMLCSKLNASVRFYTECL